MIAETFMWRKAFERGVAGLIAKQLLASKVDAIFAPIAAPFPHRSGFVRRWR